MCQRNSLSILIFLSVFIPFSLNAETFPSQKSFKIPVLIPKISPQVFQKAIKVPLPPKQPDPVIANPPPEMDNGDAPAEEDDDFYYSPFPTSQGGSLIGSTLPPPPAIPETEANQQINNSQRELIVLSTNMEEAQWVEQLLGEYNGRIIRRNPLKALGVIVSVFRFSVESVEQLAETLSLIRSSTEGLWIEFNHHYTPLKSNFDLPKNSVQNNQKALTKECAQKQRIGLLDGPVDTQHPALVKKNIIQKNFLSRGRKAAAQSHATAIATSLAGNASDLGLMGLIPEAQLYNGQIMQQAVDGSNPQTSAENIIRGLDWLLQQQVQVINLSLGGPKNILLGYALEVVMENGISIVTATNNNASDSNQIFPSSQKGVIPDTALNTEKLSLACIKKS